MKNTSTFDFHLYHKNGGSLGSVYERSDLNEIFIFDEENDIRKLKIGAKFKMNNSNYTVQDIMINMPKESQNPNGNNSLRFDVVITVDEL